MEVFLFQIKNSYINRRKMETSHTCEIYKVNVHRASFVKHFRSKSN